MRITAGWSSRRPERPRRWRRLETVGGAPIWATESTLPTSIPSSRVDVQIAVTGVERSFSRSSAYSRISLARLPW